MVNCETWTPSTPQVDLCGGQSNMSAVVMNKLRVLRKGQCQFITQEGGVRLSANKWLNDAGTLARGAKHTTDITNLLVPDLQAANLLGVARVNIFWMHGETDSEQVAWADAYEDNLLQWLDWLRQDLQLPWKKIHFCAGKIWFNDPGHVIYGEPRWARIDQIRAAVVAVAAAVTAAGGTGSTVETSDLPRNSGDRVHFNSDADAETFATRLHDAIPL